MIHLAAANTMWATSSEPAPASTAGRPLPPARAPRPPLPAPPAAGAPATATHLPWAAFLDRLTAPPVGLSPPHARAVRQVWDELSGGVGPALPVPAAGPDETGALLLHWSTPRFAAELAVHADGQIEWFFRDHDTGAHDGTEQPTPGGPPLLLYHLFLRALAP